MRDYKIIVPGTLLGVLAGFPSVSAGQEQSTPPSQTTLEEVVVTGTSIRGSAPVGSNLITVGRAEIEASGAQTLAQVLRMCETEALRNAVNQSMTHRSPLQSLLESLGG